MSGGDPVAYLVVLGLRDDMPRYQFIRILEGTLSDNAVGVALGHTRQVEQVFPRSVVDVNRPVAAHAFLHALRHRLGVASHRLRGLSGPLADLVRIVFVGSAGGE